jgi:hypothetical protein
MADNPLSTQRVHEKVLRWGRQKISLPDKGGVINPKNKQEAHKAYNTKFVEAMAEIHQG